MFTIKFDYAGLDGICSTLKLVFPNLRITGEQSKFVLFFHAYTLFPFIFSLTLSQPLSLYPEASGPALDLLEKILQWDPAKRPTAAEALSHPYFDDIRDADFEQVREIKISSSIGCKIVYL
jgi:serine/threonine protein kinase